MIKFDVGIVKLDDIFDRTLIYNVLSYKFYFCCLEAQNIHFGEEMEINREYFLMICDVD